MAQPLYIEAGKETYLKEIKGDQNMRRGFKIAASLVLGLALAAFSASAAQADSKPSGGLNVVSSSIVGSTVQVVVSNSGETAKSATVEVVASVLGFPVTSSKTVQVQAQGTAVVSVGFVLPVSNVITVGVSDGQDPF